jgi:hypothetical protein
VTYYATLAESRAGVYRSSRRERKRKKEIRKKTIEDLHGLMSMILFFRGTGFEPFPIKTVLPVTSDFSVHTE